jgi:hypothetical protein
MDSIVRDSEPNETSPQAHTSNCRYLLKAHTTDKALWLVELYYMTHASSF